MGSIITDCCVTDDGKRMRVRHDKEGSQNMDTRPLVSMNDSIESNPSIYTHHSETEYSTEACAQESIQYIINIEAPTEDCVQDKAPSSSPEKEEENDKKVFFAPTVEITEKIDTKDDVIIIKAKAKPKKTKSFKIIVTEPLSPRNKLQNKTKSFWGDDHPYSKHKQKQKLLAIGYIRRYNISSISTASFPQNILGLIFSFYYFHYADYDSQQGILNSKQKQTKSIQLVTSKHEKEENLAQFLSTILNSKLAEKMWKKFDSDLKGVVETDRFAQFLILPIILYKSTLLHRHSKESNNKKLNLNKKVLKHDVEHLAVWIITKYGEKQYDNSYHFVLTKHLYKTQLSRFIKEYIRINSI